MNRKEYIERLEQLLGVLPLEEREEALQYYTDYFEDAGVEKVEEVILELGSPEEVAAKIRAGFCDNCGEYSERGYEDLRFHNQQAMMTEIEKAEGTWEKIDKENGNMYQIDKQNKNTNVWKIIAIIVLVLFAAPILIPLVIAAIAIVISLVIAVIVTFFAIALSGIAILVSGIVAIAVGITKIFAMPATGILTAGIGGVLLALGILISWGMIFVLVKMVPWIIRGIVKLLERFFRKAGGA